MRSFIHAFDTSLATYVAKLPIAVYHPFVKIGHVASPFAWAVIIGAFVAIERPSSMSASMLVLLFMPLATFSKFIFHRRRPPTIYAGKMKIKSYSFPSSHAYSSALSSLFLAFVLFQQALFIPAALLMAYSITVAVSRVYLGAHYPSDVIAGYLLGIAVTTGILCFI